MQTLLCYRLLSRYTRSPGSQSSYRQLRSASCRSYSSSDHKGRHHEKPTSTGADSDDLFSSENIEDLSPVEVARMRVTYGLVKEHMDAVERGLAEVDPETNPLIDPRSFEVRTLPEVPEEVLRHFRQEVPPDVAAVSKPVSTHGIWEAIRSGESHDLLTETADGGASEWQAVDERTMDPRQLSRMQRQAVTGQAAQPSGPPSPMAMVGQPRHKKKKKPCPLKDERGRVRVDFRAVGTLTAFLSENLKLLPRRKSGLCAKSQRKLAKAVKTARTMALIHPEPKPRLTVEEMMEIDKNLP